MNIRAEERSK